MTDSPDAPLPGPHQVLAVAVVAAGGVLGALARYGVAAAVPVARGGFPWPTFWVNVSGCLLIGVLMGLRPRPLVRLFLGTGVLGGYTTFSAYADQVRELAPESIPLATAYAGATVLAAVAAAALGAWLTGGPRR